MDLNVDLRFSAVFFYRYHYGNIDTDVFILDRDSVSSTSNSRTAIDPRLGSKSQRKRLLTIRK
jgi:hypothetical protein